MFEHSLKNAYIGERQTVQTFDFQNDGDLGWTATSIGYGTPSYTTGEGWTIYRSNNDSQGYIAPPASVYNGGTLQKVKIWMYKGAATTGNSSRAYAVGTGVEGNTGGFMWSYAGANINYDRISTHGTFIQTANITGEVVIEADYTGATTVITINGNVYNTTEDTSLSKGERSNGNFGLWLGNWRCGSGDLYIRKLEITTVA